MRLKSAVYCVLIYCLAIDCPAQSPAALPQASSQSQPVTSSPPSEAPPSATPYQEAISNPADPLRLKRSSYYDSPPGTRPLDEDSYSVVELASADPVELPDLPVNNSDAIVVGAILAQHAYLSADRTAIYTEFKVQVEQLLKSPGGSSLEAGKVVDLEREGGSIQFSSDALISRGLANKTLPSVGKRYLLFLEYHPDGKDFAILTGYRLEGPLVTPLDKTYTGPGSMESVRDNDNKDGLPPLPPPIPDPRTEFVPGASEAQLLSKVKAALISLSGNVH